MKGSTMLKPKLAQAVISTTNFVKKHKTAIAVTATAATCIAVHVTVVRDYNEFLKEHDLFDKYFTPMIPNPEYDI